jgi:DNA-binding transcriptional MocR family regulator
MTPAGTTQGLNLLVRSLLQAGYTVLVDSQAWSLFQQAPARRPG